MKVSERIQRIRAIVELDDFDIADKVIITQIELIQLEVDIVEALQIARQEGYIAGWNERGM